MLILVTTAFLLSIDELLDFFVGNNVDESTIKFLTVEDAYKFIRNDLGMWSKIVEFAILFLFVLCFTKADRQSPRRPVRT